ncbi:hypothetical protein E1B77_20715 [Salmonella enterica subsp. enterica]|nr:hypothetical protein [Salmonella enterica subsp. enterica]
MTYAPPSAGLLIYAASSLLLQHHLMQGGCEHETLDCGLFPLAAIISSSSSVNEFAASFSVSP